jgi:hypothetical protein
MNNHLVTIAITNWKGGSWNLARWGTEVPHANLSELSYCKAEWLIRIYE